jgi:tetratricopeptide (TPR) repeat protein
MSTRNQTNWIVRDSEGRIFGPFTTAEVLVQIDKGYFQGTEDVATYPGGMWTPLSSAPEFVDRLLDALAAELTPAGRRAATPQVMDPSMAEETRHVGPIKSPAKTVSPKPPQTAPSSPDPLPALTGPAPSSQATSVGAVIDLTDMKAIERKEKGKSISLPVIMMGVAFALGAAALFMNTDRSNESRIRLLAPRKGQPEITEAKIREKFGRAMASFLTDTFSGYQRAQNELVETIEGAPNTVEYASKKAEMMSTLCLVYRELWPYAYQDSKDQKTVSQLMQETKRIDPAGLRGSLCEIVNLMVNGRMRDAQGLTESMLLEESQAPVLFEMRGDLYASMRDPANAASYFNQARMLWPAWKKTTIQEARALASQKKYPASMQLYREVLAAVPKHAVAQIELGLIEFGQFAHEDQALNLLLAALDSGERVPKQLEASAYLELAEIHLKRNQKGKALDYARRAYALNSANERAKELIVLLAGAKELQNTKIEGRELMYFGDQHERSGDCFSAQAEYKAAFEAEPKNGVAALKAAKCLWKLNQSGEAIEWLKKAIQAEPQLTAAYVELADYYARRYDFQSAMQALYKIKTIQPKSYEVYRGFATVELRRNNFAGAASYAEQALKLYETDLDTFIIMARARLGLQEYQEAQAFASKAIEIDINSIEAQSLYAKIEAGLHGVDAGAQYAQTLINRFVLTKGQQVPPPAIEYRITLGEIYIQDERFHQAEEVLRQAISLDPNNKKALMNLGKVLQAQGQWLNALEVYLKAAVLDPSDAEPIFFSGQVYAEQGRLKDAVSQFERVVRNNPRYPKAHIALGRAALLLDDPKRALEESMQERSVNPELADAYLLTAESYYALKQYGNCAAEYQKAVTKGAKGAIVFVRMARCYRLTGALESAQSLLRQAQSLESGLPELYKEQGAIYHMKGQADEALTAYETYLKLVPNAADKDQVSAVMKRIQSGDMTPGDGG